MQYIFMPILHVGVKPKPPCFNMLDAIGPSPKAPDSRAPLGVQQIDEGLPFGVAQGAGQAIFASAASSAPTNTMRIITDTKKIQKGVRKGG
jgi:hypothetical protein